MSETVHVRPAEGRRVRHPVTNQVIGDEGAHLQRDMFVERRLTDGDLELVPGEPASPEPAPPVRRK